MIEVTAICNTSSNRRQLHDGPNSSKCHVVTKKAGRKTISFPKEKYVLDFPRNFGALKVISQPNLPKIGVIEDILVDESYQSRLK